MKMALLLARKGAGAASPNPMVGAVVVAGGAVVGRGWHSGPGTAHAEEVAIRQAGPAAAGATVYTTLEPCSHFGKTPPCAQTLAGAGIRRVVAAIQDPDPRVAGKGFEMLRAAGIEVHAGCLGRQAEALNRAYLMHRANNRPLVILKAAATLDGRTSAADGTSRWITGPAARADVHRLRASCDAICVGVATVLADNPSLTVRTARRPPRMPLRLVVDSTARTPASSKVLNGPSPALVAVTQAAPQKALDALRSAGAEVAVIESDRGRVSLPALLRLLAGRGVMSVLVEGGPTLAAGLKAAGLIDRYVVYLAPRLIGDGAPGIIGPPAAPSIDLAGDLEIESVRRIGRDIRVEARPAVISNGKRPVEAGMVSGLTA